MRVHHISSFIQTIRGTNTVWFAQTFSQRDWRGTSFTCHVWISHVWNPSVILTALDGRWWPKLKKGQTKKRENSSTSWIVRRRSDLSRNALRRAGAKSSVKLFLSSTHRFASYDLLYVKWSIILHNARYRVQSLEGCKRTVRCDSNESLNSTVCHDAPTATATNVVNCNSRQLIAANANNSRNHNSLYNFIYARNFIN